MPDTPPSDAARAGIAAPRDGFTLIEVLVVVAIIALLIAILLPSLVRVRELSKVTVCAVNAKQIAYAMMEYQAEAKGYVPVMLNSAAQGGKNPPIPARVCSLSVALRHYNNKSRGTLSDSSSPFYFDSVWNTQTVNAYEKSLMPEYYSCPFGRGQGPYYSTPTPPVITAGFAVSQTKGQFESYDTWRWQSLYRGRDMFDPSGGMSWPSGSPRGPGDGIVQYGVLSWNRETTDPKLTIAEILNANRRWENTDLRQANGGQGGSPSELSVSWCTLGAYMDWPWNNAPSRVNVGAHRQSTGDGGTNAIFADAHVQWVKGTRIGWQ